MSALANVVEYPYLPELNDLFYRFRLGHLNERYYAQVRDHLESRDLAIQIMVVTMTGIAFAVLGVNEFLPHDKLWVAKLVALVASTVAFLVAAVAPWLKLGTKINEAQVAAFAWNSAVREIEKAMRYIKNARQGDPQVAVWMHTADSAYQTAVALPSPKDQDNRRVGRLFREVEAQFPCDYVWTSL